MAKNIHPATYSDALIPVFYEEIQKWVTENKRWLDCHGGDGRKFAQLMTSLFLWPLAVDIEPAFVKRAHPCVQLGDSTNLPFADNSIGGGMTSPSYPNGISDNWHASDGSRHITYVHYVRDVEGPEYELHPNNTGGTNPRRSPKAYATFMDLNRRIYAEMFRVLEPGAAFLVNTKNTKKYQFTADTREQLTTLGFVHHYDLKVGVNGMNYGENQENKEDYETIAVFQKPAHV